MLAPAAGKDGYWPLELHASRNLRIDPTARHPVRCNYDASQPIPCQTNVGVIPIGVTDLCPFLGQEDCIGSCIWDAQGLECRRR